MLNAAIKSGKDDFELNMELAGILEAQAEAGEALKHLRRALELQPDSVPVRVEMVALLLGMGQQAEAADVLKEIVKLKPDDVPSLLELGYVYAKLKRYDDAAKTAESILRIDPKNTDAEALLALSRPAAGTRERRQASRQAGRASQKHRQPAPGTAGDAAGLGERYLRRGGQDAWRPEDLRLRHHLQRGGQHRRVPGDDEVGRRTGRGGLLQPGRHREIARRYTDRVIQRPFTAYTEQTRFACEQCTGTGWSGSTRTSA